MELTQVRQDENAYVAELYKRSLGTPGCVWSESYPTIEDITHDVAEGLAFGIRDEQGSLLAVCSLEEDDVKPFDFCKDKESASYSICRVVTVPEQRGRGLCRRLLEALEVYWQQKGLVWLRLLVSPENEPACRCYMGAGYRVIGECDCYDRHWLACEKRLQDEAK